MSTPCGKGARRPAPFSLRLTAQERERLLAQAGGTPLGAFIKSRLFAGDAPVKRSRNRAPVREERALAQVLARLGASRLASNMNQLAHAANTGSLFCDDEVTGQLLAACADIKSMRAMLVSALGLKGAPPTPSVPSPRRAFSLAGNGESGS